MKKICMIIIIFIFIGLVYKYTFLTEMYDKREGFFASIMTQNTRSDGNVDRLASHYKGEYLPDSNTWSIDEIEEGVINLNEVQFINTFYNDEDGVNNIIKYNSNPELYPNPSTIKKLSEESSHEIHEYNTVKNKILTLQQELRELTDGFTSAQITNSDHRDYVTMLQSKLDIAQEDLQKKRESLSYSQQKSRFYNLLSPLFDSLKESSNSNNSNIDESTTRSYEIYDQADDEIPTS